MEPSRDAAAPLDPETPEAKPRERRHLAANQHAALTQLLQHPGWAIYSQALRAKREALLGEMRSCLRRGDPIGAMLKSGWADTIDDCLDLTQILLGEADWTMSQTEDQIAKALREERQFMQQRGGR